MKLKMVIACGMLLGLLCGVSYAQRGRFSAGAHSAVPGARLPAANPGDSLGNIGTTHLPSATKGPIAPNAHTTTATNPSSVKSTAPAAETRPSAESDPAATTVKPNAGTVPDRVTGPNGNAVDGRANVGPTQ